MTAPAYEKKSFVKPEGMAPCAHPRESLVQMGQQVCDADLVTVCTQCGISFPGQTSEDLTVA